MKRIKYRTFCADFETTVYSGQDHTEVWAAALVEIGSEEVTVTNSIEAFFAPIYEMLKHAHVKLYFHNLKFDGSFILDHFIRNTDFKEASFLKDNDNPYTRAFRDDKNMLNGSYKYMISDIGQWYMITLKLHNHFLEIVDSFKLIPFSLDSISKSFATKHKKLSIEYTGFRQAGGYITQQEQDYIRNDVLVLKEALEIMFETGHTRLTIGSCCLAEYKSLIGKWDFKDWFPDMTRIELQKDLYGSDNADAYIRRAYRGGWCYVAKGKEGKTYHDGITLDVNSLYPSVMSGESGNEYPYGNPCFWSGDYIPDQALKPHRYFYIRIRTRFQIKDGYLPTIQIKNLPLYRKNEYLESSRITLNGRKFSKVRIGDMEIDDHVILTLSQTDYYLMLKHYELYDTQILDGCWFFARAGLFDCYIEKYKKIKMESSGATRTLAKLYLNNLYGKLATGVNSSYKIAYLTDSGDIGFYTIPEHDKRVIYIPAGAAVTAYAREFTINAAQQNYYGDDQPGFIYADTDSIHCDLPLDRVNGIRLHDTDFLCWKHEATWKTGMFLRQKTYIEMDEENCNVTACGMGKRCKELISSRIQGADIEIRNEQEAEFFERFQGLDDFRIGLEIPSNLKQKRMKGGVVLMEDYFCLR